VLHLRWAEEGIDDRDKASSFSAARARRSTSSLGAMEMSRSASYLIGMSLALGLCACGPAYPPPAGFVEACYGGNFAKKLDGAAPKFTMHIRALQSQWPQLAQRFKAFGELHKLEFFDTSVNEPGLRMINVHLCSPSGLWLFADKRIWDGGVKDSKPDEVPIYLFQYAENYDWKTIATEFERSMSDWPEAAPVQGPVGSRNGS